MDDPNRRAGEGDELDPVEDPEPYVPPPPRFEGTSLFDEGLPTPPDDPRAAELGRILRG